MRRLLWKTKWDELDYSGQRNGKGGRNGCEKWEE